MRIIMRILVHENAKFSYISAQITKAIQSNSLIMNLFFIIY
jgi:hypothetical protein